jgi:signal transduction histidine kinase
MSLLQYLSQRLLLLGLVISSGIFYIVYILYQWGLDDSTEYYLTQDMQWAIEVLAKGQALPKNTEFRQFYLSGFDHNSKVLVDDSFKNSADQSSVPQMMPNKYTSILEFKKDSEFFYLEDNIAFQYGLHQILADGRSLMLIHQFLIDDAAEEGMSLLTISMLSSSILILIMLIGAGFIYRRVALSMQHLLYAAQRNDRQDVAKKSSGDKEFFEVDKIITSLKNALKDLENKNTQERLFIQTLSHELRTPMATVQIALELLGKKELDDNVREKLRIIFNSNQQMQQLSNELLSLWTSSKQSDLTENNESLDLEEELKEVIDELDRVFHCKQRFIIKSQHNDSAIVNVLAAKAHLRLLLNNLCKNAIVHSDSEIAIFIQHRQIIISNDKSQQEIDPLVAGSGIGLIIATRAAELLGWQIKLSETEVKYELSVLLDKPS